MRRLSSPRRRAALAAVFAALFALPLAAGCDKPSHENLDKWMTTEKGPGKLRSTLTGSDHPADLRAHAAQNLVLMDRFAEVKEAVEAMPERERVDLMTQLAPRLWDSARFKPGQDALAMPSPEQNMAKDALFDLRGHAPPPIQQQIDGWLTEWLAGGYFEGRAKEGRIPARQIIRKAGKVAAQPLIDHVRSLLARPANPDGSRPKIGDETLKALALTADAAAIGFLLDLSTGESKDETIGPRSTAALWEAFVQPPPGIDPLEDGRGALLPHLEKLQTMLRNESLSGSMHNDVADLIAVIGPPECLPRFLDLITFPHERENYLWMGTQKGIRCAGADAIVPVVEAIPVKPYDRGRLEKYVWREILAINAKARVAAEARTLLGSKSPIARVTGAEVLRGLAIRDSAAEDAKKIGALAGDRTVLKGWWGKEGEKGKKPDPTVGQVAADVAKSLQELASGAGTK